VVVLDAQGAVTFANSTAQRLFAGQRLQNGRDLELGFGLDEGATRVDGGGTRHVRGQLAGGGDLGGYRLAIYAIPIEAWTPTGDRTVIVACDVASDDRAARVREAFASIVAHELRTPVTTIYGGAQLIAEPTVSDETRRQAAIAVATEADHLYRLVEDLVVLAQFDRLPIRTQEPVLLQRVLPGLVADQRARDRQPIELELPNDLPAVIGHNAAIAQVMRHLVTSAARFNPAGQPVVVEVVPDPPVATISVIDAGPAVSPRAAATLFDLFSDSSRTASDAAGVNLSMFVCRRLVEAMGGRIEARPRSDVAGMEVRVSLRIAEEAD